jgi:hypothetical protein
MNFPYEEWKRVIWDIAITFKISLPDLWDTPLDELLFWLEGVDYIQEKNLKMKSFELGIQTDGEAI